MDLPFLISLRLAVAAAEFVGRPAEEGAGPTPKPLPSGSPTSSPSSVMGRPAAWAAAMDAGSVLSTSVYLCLSFSSISFSKLLHFNFQIKSKLRNSTVNLYFILSIIFVTDKILSPAVVFESCKNSLNLSYIYYLRKI